MVYTVKYVDHVLPCHECVNVGDRGTLTTGDHIHHKVIICAAIDKQYVKQDTAQAVAAYKSLHYPGHYPRSMSLTATLWRTGLLMSPYVRRFHIGPP